ncbi:MAG: RNA 2'-phosphotransferase [Pseudomonadota bacterium]
MERRNEKRLSKFLALVLRHKAERHGLTVEEGTGWADLDAVLTLLEKKFGRRFVRRELADLAFASPDGKVRFQVEGRKIRALYGHFQVEVRYPVTTSRSSGSPTRSRPTSPRTPPPS